MIDDTYFEKIYTKLIRHVTGSYSGFIPMLLEGNWTLKLQIPDTNETLTETVQVRMSDLESENPSRNEPLLKEIAQKTDGEYFDSPYLAVSENDTSFFDRFPVRSQQSVLDTTADERTMRVFLYVLCTLLCVEWTLRRLMRLA